MVAGLPHTLYSRGMQTIRRCCAQKGMVLNVRAKGTVKVSGKCKGVERKWIVEDMSKQINCWQNWGLLAADRKTVTENCLLVAGQPALRRQELYTGFYLERERFTCWCAKSFVGILLKRATVDQKIYSSYCNSILLKAGDATGSVGLDHSSDEVSVMEMEQRVQLIHVY